MTYLQRKKLAFMSIVNRIKGFVRTVFGVPPITLPNCVDEESLINYSIEGNSIQNGTPTPDTPIEVESVGEKTKNLIGDYQYINQATRYYNVITTLSKHTFKQGTTYVISFDTPNTGKDVCFSNYSHTEEGLKTVSMNGTRRAIIFTPTQDLSINKLVAVTSVVSEDDKSGLCSDCMIEELNDINIFDVSNTNWLEQGGLSDSTGGNSSSTKRVRTDLISLEEGKYYITISEYNNLKLRIRGIHIYNYYTEKWEAYTPYNNVSRKQFTISTRCKVRFIFQTSSDDVITTDDIIGGNPMLFNYDYEPYGYKIPVVCSGKNLFDKDGFCAYYNSFNTTYKANANDNYLGEDCFSYKLRPPTTTSEFSILKGKFKENTQYKISCYATYKWANAESRTIPFMAIKYTDGTTATIQKTLYADRFTRVTYTTAENKTIDYLYLQNFASGVPAYLKDFQIEEGTIATDYEPYVESTTNIYLDEPLRKIGSYADYVDFENQKVIRRIWSEYITTVDGTSSLLATYRVYLSDISKKPIIIDNGANIVVLANKFKQSPNWSYGQLSKYPNSCLSYITSSGVNRIAYTFDDKSLSTIEQGQQALGDGFEVNYVLAEEEESPIPLPKLPTFKGTTIYSIDTQVQPSNMSATYYATSKE